MAANEKNLFDGIGALDIMAGLSRDNAAQLIYNGINAEMVAYSNVLGTDANGQLTSTPTVYNTGKTIITDKYKAVKVEGIVTNNEFLAGDTMKGKTRVMLNNAAGINQFGAPGAPRTPREVTFNVKTGADEVGKTITLYVKPASAASDDASQATVLGKATISSVNNVYKTNKALVYDSSKSNDITKTLEAAGLKFEDEATVTGSTVTTYSNLISPYAFAKETSGDRYANRASAKTNISKWLNSLGVEAQYIDNDGDGIIEVVTYLKYAFGRVNTATTAGNGMLNVTVLGNANVPTLTESTANTTVVNFANLGLAAKDYVKYYVAAGKYYVEKVSGVTVDVTATTGAKVTASGTTYEASSLASFANLASNVTLGDKAVFFLDGAGAVIYVDSVTTTDNYLMLVAVAAGTGTFGDTITAKVVKDDATVEVITISKVGSTKIDSGTASAQRSNLASTTIDQGANAVIYTYNVDSNGKYELTAQTTVKSLNTTVTKNVPQIATTIVANTNTPFIVNSTNTYTRYTGINNVVSHASADVFAVVGNNNIAKVVFTYGGTGAVDSNNYMYVLSKTPTITKENGSNVYTYKVVRGGEVTTIKGTGASIFPGAGVYKVTLTGTEVSGATPSDARIVASDKAKVAANGVISNTSNSYFYDANTKFFIIKGGVATETTVDAIVTATGAEDVVSMILGTGANANTAQYVFIERDALIDVAAPVVVDGNGLTLTASLNKAKAAAGDTVIVTVTVTGTASAAGTIVIGGVTPAGTTLASATNMTRTDDRTISVVAAADTSGTITFTYTLDAANTAATITAS